ncbi:uncharacterized protein LOC114933798 isoform X2 [Nylanderia fulva]|uniref:uncharacterized protein LOC114933798 isoform X2 n=1 Tax=Nylanderia fulva TaxID=613905 RepID=UPI0010FB12FE|nr:uncharacterized protein LOC114933798 isoform X2 [Nylanderia fulva]
MIETENDEESNVTSKLQLRASSSIKETGSQSSVNQPDKDADMELSEEIIDSSQEPSTRTRNAEDDTQTTNRKEQENVNKQVTNINKVIKSDSFVVINGILEKVSDIDKETYDKIFRLNNQRYDSKITNVCKINCKINTDHVMSNRGKNCTKILLWCNKNGVFPINIEMIKFNLSTISFKNAKEANDCLDKIDKVENKWLTGFIDKKLVTCRGVIVDWPFEIPELWENIVEREDILKIEKMKKSIWNKTDKKYEVVNTNNFIITMKGNKIKDSLTIFNNLHISLRIRPYVEPVVQCFKCFIFGHIKTHCKREVRCIICGENAHGECNRLTTCRNCGGDHRSTARNCPVFLRNKEIKVIMAYNNISFTEAERLITGKNYEQIIPKYDRKEKENPTVIHGPSREGQGYTHKPKEREAFRREKEKIEEGRQAYLNYYREFQKKIEEPLQKRSEFLAQIMKDKCKESEDFNRDFANLLHKHRIPLDRFPIYNEKEDIRQEENNREIYVRKRKMEKYQEELTKAKMVRQNMKRNYWEDRNNKEDKSY